MKRQEFIKTLVIGAIAGPTLLEACKKTDGNSESTSTNTSNAAVIEVTSCSTETGINKIICLVNAFKALLSTSQLSTVQLSYSKSDAIRWSNFPQALFSLKRVGLNFGAMTDTQIGYAKAIVKELAGSTITNEGWDEIQQILNADDYLKTVNANGGYGSENYYLAFLGTPGTSGTFSIMFGGHHLAFQNTYKDGILTGTTPSFRGIEPKGTFTYNGSTNQPLEQESAALLAVLNSFSSTELTTAKITGVSDLVAGPQKDSAIPTTYSGIKVGNLTTAQKALVLAAIKTYVVDVAEYTPYLTTYTNELDNTYVCFAGNSTLSAQGDYFRIHGPSVWVEWAVQGPVALSQPHIHSVWRDRLKDYGGN